MSAHQERLFVVAEQSGQVAPVDFSSPTEGVAVNLQERNIRLQNVITLLAQKSMLEGFVSFGAPAEQYYGEHAESVRTNAHNRIEAITLAAKQEFAHASGHYALIEAGEPRLETARSTRTLFSDFLKRFYGARHYQAAQAFRRKLAADAEGSHSAAFEQSTVHKTRNETQLKPLTNHEKLKAILNDDRAGFLPATNNEKTKILTLLDYIDDPSGTSEQLKEIFRSAQGYFEGDDQVGHTWRGVSEGKRAVESVIYEMGDFAENALSSHTQLLHLQQILTGIINPNLTLKVFMESEFGEGYVHEGYAPLARFVALQRLYNSQNPKILPPSQDPMKTVEDRWTREGEGKHKAITDRYTAKYQTEDETEDEIQNEIQNLVNQITVHEARSILACAIQNEEKRAQFFLQRLREVTWLNKSSRIFKAITEITEQIVGEYAEPA